jgi:hypothetical protein
MFIYLLRVISQQSSVINWFPGSAWESMSRGSASLAEENWRQSLRICVTRQSLGTSKTVNSQQIRANPRLSKPFLPTSRKFSQFHKAFPNQQQYPTKIPPIPGAPKSSPKFQQSQQRDFRLYAFCAP